MPPLFCTSSRRFTKRLHAKPCPEGGHPGGDVVRHRPDPFPEQLLATGPGHAAPGYGSPRIRRTPRRRTPRLRTPRRRTPRRQTPRRRTPRRRTPRLRTPRLRTPRLRIRWWCTASRASTSRCRRPASVTSPSSAAIALDPNVNFSDLAAMFGTLTGRTEHTTARWTGKLTAPQTGDYTFFAIGDNGFRFFLDGTAVIDHWVGDWDIEQTQRTGAPRRGRGSRLPASRCSRTSAARTCSCAGRAPRWLRSRSSRTSAFTPPDDFQVYPVEPTVGEDGRTADARLRRPVDRARRPARPPGGRGRHHSNPGPRRTWPRVTRPAG